jgi:DNA-binding response OmpR family regulator
MLVEDDNTTATIIQKHAAALGYTLSASATTGEEAIAKIDGNLPEVIIMDITLEGDMDGIDSAKFINERYDIPIVYITASSEEAIVDRIKHTNAFGYIVKPIDKRELKAAIEMALLRHDMERSLKENENKFSTILNSIGDAVIVADSSDRITYMNPVAEFMTGRPFAEVSGKKLNAVVHIENETLENIKANKSFALGSKKGTTTSFQPGAKKSLLITASHPRKTRPANSSERSWCSGTSTSG